MRICSVAAVLATVLIVGSAALRGDDRITEVRSFQELVASVARPPALEKIQPGEEARLAYCVSDDAMGHRKAAVLEKAVEIVPDNKPSGKQSLRVDLARLMRDPQDRAAWENVQVVAPFSGNVEVIGF